MTASLVMPNGNDVAPAASSLFYIAPVAHDSWVIGDEEYVSSQCFGVNQ